MDNEEPSCPQRGELKRQRIVWSGKKMTVMLIIFLFIKSLEESSTEDKSGYGFKRSPGPQGRALS